MVEARTFVRYTYAGHSNHFRVCSVVRDGFCPYTVAAYTGLSSVAPTGHPSDRVGWPTRSPNFEFATVVSSETTRRDVLRICQHASSFLPRFLDPERIHMIHAKPNLRVREFVHNCAGYKADRMPIASIPPETWGSHLNMTREPGLPHPGHNLH